VGCVGGRGDVARCEGMHASWRQGQNLRGSHTHIFITFQDTFQDHTRPYRTRREHRSTKQNQTEPHSAQCTRARGAGVNERGRREGEEGGIGERVLLRSGTASLGCRSSPLIRDCSQPQKGTCAVWGETWRTDGALFSPPTPLLPSFLSLSS